MAFELNTSLPINNNNSVIKAQGSALTNATASTTLIAELSSAAESAADYQKSVEVTSGNPLSQDANDCPTTIQLTKFPLSGPTINNAYAFLNFEGNWIVRTTGAVTKPTTSDFYTTSTIGPEAAAKSTFLIGRHPIQTAV